MGIFIGICIFVVAGIGYSVLYHYDKPEAEEIAIMAEDVAEDAVEEELHLPQGIISKEINSIEKSMAEKKK